MRSSVTSAPARETKDFHEKYPEEENELILNVIRRKNPNKLIATLLQIGELAGLAVGATVLLNVLFAG